MYIEKWGDVDGDGNADAIIGQRRSTRKLLGPMNTVLTILMLACAVWYGSSGGSGALACLIVVATTTGAGWVQRDIFESQTMLMIAERRIQIVEQKLQTASTSIYDIEGTLNRQARGREIVSEWHED